MIKNVAGYDLAKLFAGSFGTLGLILAVSVRLHPLHVENTTVLGACEDPEALGAAAVAVSSAPLELEAFDIAWRSGRGGILARCAGSEHGRRGQRVARLLHDLGLDRVEVTSNDEQLWERQRTGQRSSDRALVRVASTPTALPAVLRASESCQGTVVGRAALGSSYVELEPDLVPRLREMLPPAARAVLLDAPAQAREQPDPWGSRERSGLELMRSVKERFDPTQTCNPGLFVDGI